MIVWYCYFSLGCFTAEAVAGSQERAKDWIRTTLQEHGLHGDVLGFYWTDTPNKSAFCSEQFKEITAYVEQFKVI